MSEQFSKTYLDLKEKCDKAGTTLTKVVLNAGINPSIVQKWKRKDPKTIQLLNQINDQIEIEKNKNFEA